MVELPLGVVVLASLVPYVIRKKRLPHGKQLTIQALSWSLFITWHGGQCEWAFHLPLCERARSLFHAGPTGLLEEHSIDLHSEISEQRLPAVAQEEVQGEKR